MRRTLSEFELRAEDTVVLRRGKTAYELREWEPIANNLRGWEPIGRGDTALIEAGIQLIDSLDISVLSGKRHIEVREGQVYAARAPFRRKKSKQSLYDALDQVGGLPRSPTLERKCKKLAQDLNVSPLGQDPQVRQRLRRLKSGGILRLSIRDALRIIEQEQLEVPRAVEFLLRFDDALWQRQEFEQLFGLENTLQICCGLLEHWLPQEFRESCLRIDNAPVLLLTSWLRSREKLKVRGQVYESVQREAEHLIRSGVRRIRKLDQVTVGLLTHAQRLIEQHELQPENTRPIVLNLLFLRWFLVNYSDSGGSTAALKTAMAFVNQTEQASKSVEKKLQEATQIFSAP